MATVIQPTTFTNPSGVLIADYLSGASANPPYGNYNIAGPTLVGGIKVAAAVEVQSTTGAVLFPRMTTTLMNALTPVVDGMLIYNTTAAAFYGREAGAWGAFGAGNVVGPSPSTTDAIAVFGNNVGNTLLNTLVTLNPITAIISGVAQLFSGVGSATTPTYSFGTDTNTGLFQAGTDVVGIAAGGTIAFEAIGGTSNVNWLSVSGGTTGNAPLILANGSDTNIAITYVTKGTGAHNFSTGTGTNIQFQISNITSAVNFLVAAGGISGSGVVSINASGTDTNLDVDILGKGTGAVQITNALVVPTGTIGAAAGATIRVGSATASGVTGTTLAWNGAGVGGVTTINPTSPDRTVAVVINGTTYYLAAKTTND